MLAMGYANEKPVRPKLARTGFPFVREHRGTVRFERHPGVREMARSRLKRTQSSSASGPVIISSATSSVRPRMAASNLAHISVFSVRNFFAFSRPWPMRTLS